MLALLTGMTMAILIPLAGLKLLAQAPATASQPEPSPSAGQAGKPAAPQSQSAQPQASQPAATSPAKAASAPGPAAPRQASEAVSSPVPEAPSGAGALNQPDAQRPSTTSTAAPPAPVIPPGPPAGVGFRLENADLLQFISLVAAQLKINYVVDPAVKGTVTISTAGDLRTTDLLPILETVLRINGATAIQTGNFYRIVPLAAAPKNPLAVSADMTGASLPQGDQTVMQIVPLRFVFASDMAKMISPFLSEGGTVAVHEAGNILILVDDALNVKRLMEILAEFDSATFADQRVRLIPVHNSVPSAVTAQLEAIFAAYALSEKNTPLRFVPLDQINGILVAAADPSAFDEVQKWVEKLDQPAAPSSMQTFVYKVQNSDARYLVQLLRAIRRGGGDVPPPTVPGTTGVSSISGLGPGAGGGFGNSGFGNQGFGSQGFGSQGFGGMGTQGPQMGTQNLSARRQTQNALGTSNQGAAEEVEENVGSLHLVADTVSNSIIFQGTAQQYAEIADALKKLDVVPREVVIEARIYEVDLTGDLSFGVEYMLQQRSGASKQFLASFTSASNFQGSVGTIIGSTRELLAFLNADDNRSRVRMLSAPTILATDSTDAHIQIGASVPVLTSQGVIPGVQVGTTSVFSNTVTNVDTGVILNVVPRITSTGMVSLSINQEVSQEEPLPSGGIQSPSFTKRDVATHAVVQDGQTVALGGIIQYSNTLSTNRVPLLGAIPFLGALFGSTQYQTQETELIVLITPRIINNFSEATAATRELRDQLKGLQRSFKKDEFLNR